MICYKDKTFCLFEDCVHFDVDCDRSLTDQIKKEAVIWWGSDEAPIAIFTDKPDCFEKKKDE